MTVYGLIGEMDILRVMNRRLFGRDYTARLSSGSSSLRFRI